ncbi:MAG: endonuclease/exonuclease/phosphatase family protein [Pseudomonadota bacterium]
MKKSLLVIGLVIFSLQPVAFAALKPSMISVMSWNILGPSAKDAQDFFPRVKKPDQYDRLSKIAEKIILVDPLILCLQEVDKKSLNILSSLLHTYIPVAYKSQNKNGGVVVYVKKNAFDLQLTIEVDLHGKGVAAGALFTFKKTGTQLLVCSIHISRNNAFNNANIKEGEKQLEILMKKLTELIPHLKNSACILAGDFNANSSEISGSTLSFLESITHKKYQDSLPNQITANRPDGTPSSIDHILYSDLIFIEEESYVGKMDFEHSPLIHKQYPSDHLPIYCQFKENK